MFILLSRSFYSILSLILLLALVACGKEANNKKNASGTEPQRDEIRNEIEALLKKQKTECANQAMCPEAVAKVLVAEKNNFRICTGFMVSKDVIATSSSCLTLQVRVSGNRCAGELFAQFPKIGARESQTLNCKEVILASEVAGSDPNLWASDIAYIRLEKSPGLNPLKISRKGFIDRENFDVWKVDAISDELGVIRKETCTTVLDNYINPLANNKFAPNLIVSGCKFNRGNRGAPLMKNGKTFSGLFSQFVDKYLVDSINRTGLLRSPLLDMGHVANGACIPQMSEVFNEDDSLPDACFASLTYQQLDRKRAEMINTDLIFGSNREGLIAKLESAKPYLKWKVEIVSRSLGASQFKIIPKCFMNIQEWIKTFYYRRNYSNSYTYTVSANEQNLNLSITPDARVEAQMTEGNSVNYHVRFSPRELTLSPATSPLEVWTWSQDDTRDQVFSGTVSECK